MLIIYYIIIFAAAVIWTLRGFRKGFARQTPSVIGVAFGIVSTRLLAPGLTGTLHGALPHVHGQVCETFVCQALASALIFTAVYLVFATITSFLSSVMRSENRTILDNIAGAIFSLFKVLLWLSIGLNVILALKPEGELLSAVKSDDGNTLHEVLLLAPACLGGEDAEQLALKIQLHEASKIS
ncbi:MAG: CvpA family protein [Muribaculaceae bacterium]|nr:CvpA family protein [Muribaculaceae bacterium]